MANKDIRAIYDNGVMIWPATTTTAVIDPASREALNTILGKKEDKPVEITECIPSRLMSINSAEDAVTLSSAEEAQLAPIIAGQNATTKFTYYSAQAIPLDISGAYAWEILGLRGFTGEVFWILKLCYIDEEVSGETVRSYWVEQEMKTPVFAETDPTNQPVFINIDMADLVANNGIDYPGEVWYFLSEEDDPYPESTFIDSEGRNKRIVLRIRPFEDDDYDWKIEPENSESWYFPIAIELSPLEGDYYPQDGVLHAAGTAEILRGIQLYNGILYCALVYTWEEDNNHNYYIAIHKTDIKGKISEMPAYEDVPVYPTTGDDINTAFGKINRIVQSHEEITARALLDLNNRIQNLPGGSGGGIQETTWSALKTLRDGGNLTSGRFYRITDYTCTTTQTDTQSAGHLFDIIVFALSGSTLSEKAWADHHEGDTYFSNCNLAAWELKYCLDNDTTRFYWADTTNGKGIIYWMKDEWGNECPYDFKNIQYTNVGFDTTEALYTFSNSVSGYPDHSISGVVYNNYIESFNYVNTSVSQRLNNFVLIVRKGTIICNNNIEKDCINSYIYSHLDPITDNKFNKCQDLQISSLAFTFNNFEGVFGMSSTSNTSKYGITKSSIKDCTNLVLDRSGNTTTLFNHIIIEKNNKLTILASVETVKNIIITEGINESTVTVKTIDLSNAVNNPLTIYKPANSVEISV